MSFSAHKRDALDATEPVLHRMSHLRSCAMLMGQKYRVPRSEIIDRVRELSGVDIMQPATDEEIHRAVEAMVNIKQVGLSAQQDPRNDAPQ